jgi:hypothetical protein
MKLRAAIAEHNLDNLPTNLIERRTLFRRQLAKFRQYQQVYQPELGPTSDPSDDDIVNVSLALPSSLSGDAQSKCSPELVSMEKELRLGQCHDTLSSLRLHLHSKSRLLKDKYINVRHQGPNTKSRALIDRVSVHISTAADRYTIARSALNALDPNPKSAWRNEFHILNKADIRGMSEPELPDHPNLKRANAILERTLLSGGALPEGNKISSWIWRGAPTDTEAVGGYNEGLSCSSLLIFV